MTRDDVIKLAKETRARLNTKGWRLLIWENGGWYCVLRKGYISLYCSFGGSFGGEDATFMTLMGPNVAGEMHYTMGNRNSFRDPNKAVEAQLRVAERHIRKCQRQLEASK